MPRMSAPNGCNPTGMAGYREPVVNGRSNTAALYRRLTRPMMPGY